MEQIINIKLFLSISTLMTTSACSTIIHGSHDTLHVNALEEGTTIYIDGSPRGKNSAMAEVKRGKTHVIRATKKGCSDVSIETTEKFYPTTLLGILLDFGIISIPVDLISGAAWKAAPKTYTITPICESE